MITDEGDRVSKAFPLNSAKTTMKAMALLDTKCILAHSGEGAEITYSQNVTKINYCCIETSAENQNIVIVTPASQNAAKQSAPVGLSAVSVTAATAVGEEKKE